jgi:hypothetical protein
MANFSSMQRQKRVLASSSSPSLAHSVQQYVSTPANILHSLAQIPISPPASSSQQGQTTGLPVRLKTGIEQLSGISLDEVRVHYPSSRPTRLGAAAYAEGTDIHIAPGQQRHLPHEAWHVVQQKLGRVKPTLRMSGLSLNESPELEKEASTMGARAASSDLSSLPLQEAHRVQAHTAETGHAPVQMYNEYLIALAQHFGVDATIEAIASTLGISTGTLMVGLGALGTVALGWTVYKLVDYLTTPSVAQQPLLPVQQPQQPPQLIQQPPQSNQKKPQEKQPKLKQVQADKKPKPRKIVSEPEEDEESIQQLLALAKMSGLTPPKTEKQAGKTPRNKPAQIVQRPPRQRAVDPNMRGIAETALHRYQPKRKLSTICVFLDARGNVVSYGESGWGRAGRGDEIKRHLDNFLVQEKGQEEGYGGVFCAEPEAILNAQTNHSMHQVAYSLAYDRKSRRYKAACGSCKRYFTKDRSEGEEIVDLYVRPQ